MKEDMRKSGYRCNTFTMQATNGNKHIKILVLFSLTSSIMFIWWGCVCVYMEYLVKTLIAITVRYTKSQCFDDR